MVRSSRPVWAGVPIIIVLVIVSTSGAAFFLNESCRARFFDGTFSQYPNVIDRTDSSVFFGEQRLQLRTADAPAVVEDWYRLTRAEIMRGAVVSGDFRQTPSDYPYAVTVAADGTTLIDVWTTCPR